MNARHAIMEGLPETEPTRQLVLQMTSIETISVLMEALVGLAVGQ
jgi:hypothetical protein